MNWKKKNRRKWSVLLLISLIITGLNGKNHQKSLRNI